MAQLIGLFTLGRDAEIRATPTGDQVAQLSLAYEYGRKGNDGKRPTQWIDAAFWGERAVKLQEYLTKGSQFLFTLDDLHIEEFKKRDGTPGMKLTARVNSLEFTRGLTQRPAPPAPAPAPRPAPAPAASGFEDMDDEIPF